jgi:hypothetical protein
LRTGASFLVLTALAPRVRRLSVGTPTSPHCFPTPPSRLQLSKFMDLHKALAQCGIQSLYLNAQMAPTTKANAPTGGKASLHRLLTEVEALEGLLQRYRS